MDAIGDVLERKNMMALVRFTRLPVEDQAATKAAGQYVAKDIDYVFITPPYSNGGTEVAKKVTSFLADNEVKVKNGQLPATFAEHYRKQYEAWKQGQELPLEGTPIRGWSVISPAQQEMLIARKFFTVEYLAEANDEGLRSIGMEGLGLKRKAAAWVAQAKDKGGLTLKMAAVEAENDALKVQVETLAKQMQTLLDEMPKRGPGRPRKEVE